MTLLATLWLAVLHLLAAQPAAGAERRVPSSASSRAPSSATWSADSALLHRAPARDEAIRPPRPLPTLRVAHPDPVRAHAPPTQHALVASPPRATVATVTCQQVASHRSHAQAARGGVLPYYPTAPPGQG